MSEHLQIQHQENLIQFPLSRRENLPPIIETPKSDEIILEAKKLDQLSRY